jgi:hypothetical protein
MRHVLILLVAALCFAAGPSTAPTTPALTPQFVLQALPQTVLPAANDTEWKGQRAIDATTEIRDRFIKQDTLIEVKPALVRAPRSVLVGRSDVTPEFACWGTLPVTVGGRTYNVYWKAVFTGPNAWALAELQKNPRMVAIRGTLSEMAPQLGPGHQKDLRMRLMLTDCTLVPLSAEAEKDAQTAKVAGRPNAPATAVDRGQNSGD